MASNLHYVSRRMRALSVSAYADKFKHLILRVEERIAEADRYLDECLFGEIETAIEASVDSIRHSGCLV